MVYYFEKIFLRNFLESEFAKGAMVLTSYCVGSVDMEEEKKGKSNKIKSLCQLSKEGRLLIIARADCFYKDKQYNSAIVVDRGRLLGICDCVTAQPPYSCARNIYCFDTYFGRIAVLLDKDILLKDLSEKLKEEECDIVVHFGEIQTRTMSLFTAGQDFHLFSVNKEGLHIATNGIRHCTRLKNGVAISTYNLDAYD